MLEDACEMFDVDVWKALQCNRGKLWNIFNDLNDWKVRALRVATCKLYKLLVHSTEILHSTQYKSRQTI